VTPEMLLVYGVDNDWEIPVVIASPNARSGTAPS
jgi:hypothetical protein